MLPAEVVAAEARLLAPTLSRIIHDAGSRLIPDTTTMDIAAALDRNVRRHGLYPAMLGFNGFPAAAAVSVNEQVLHGIPSSRRLAVGDLVTIELSVASDSGYASQGWTFPVGRQSADAETLLSVGPQVLKAACAAAVGGARTGDVGAVIEEGLKVAGLAVVRDYVGYGMGRERIQEPSIPGYGRRGTGSKLRSGQILHVHVICKHGSPAVRIEDDGWSAASGDGRLSALFTAMVEAVPNRGRMLSSMLDEQPGQVTTQDLPRSRSRGPTRGSR